VDVNLKQNFENFISLAEASRLTGYHQDYLGFLCRTGKLNGYKIGRNWTTTKQGLELFIKNFKNGTTEVIDETGRRIPVKAKPLLSPSLTVQPRHWKSRAGAYAKQLRFLCLYRFKRHIE